MSDRRLLIVGLGWLGKQVAAEFVNKGWDVRALVRKMPEAQTNGVTYIHHDDFNQPRNEKFEADLVFISLSPRGDYRFYPNLLSNVLVMIEPGRHVVHCSSTGVYPMVNSVYREDDLVGEDEKAANLTKAEENVLKYNGKATVLRLGGLFGPGRIPGDFREGVTLSSPDSLVNWIHSNVVVDALEKVYFNQKTHKEIFNLCFDRHPTKRDFYQKNATRIGKNLLFKDDKISVNRVVNSDKIKELGVVFGATDFD